MRGVPVVEHYRPDPPRRLIHAVDRLAERLRAEEPKLADNGHLRPFAAQSLDDRPALHLDDASGIVLLEGWRSIAFQQDRARLRAGAGDFVASCIAPVEGYEEYCRGRLGLGEVTWLSPQPPRESVQVAAGCWQDIGMRKKLLQAVRREGLRFIHPHLGSRPVWELAGLLSEFAGQRLQVIAAPPAITKLVNDKIALAEVVQRLFGTDSVPRTHHAANLAHAAKIVSRLVEECRAITLKLPDSAGGGGNMVADAGEFRSLSLMEIRKRLKQRFAGFTWRGESELLIGCWETEVCRAPSAQLWIPPEEEGPPVVEGIFEQELGDRRGMFVAARPAELPSGVTGEIVERSWLLGRLFQRLGYVGRCSFDLLLVGKTPSRSRLEFIECNGRWGAVSLPMTLMNRLFGDWRHRPYAVRDVQAEGLDRVSFSALVEVLGGELYDARSGEGTLILINPARMQARSSLTALFLGSSWTESAEGVRRDVPGKLKRAVEMAMP